tara:strand:- start:43 stop:558 length:516 start_codon:yes stop_codon:yes gene_type:complete
MSTRDEYGGYGKRPTKKEYRAMYAEIEAYLKKTFAPEVERVLGRELSHQYGEWHRSGDFNDYFGKKKASHTDMDTVFLEITVKRKHWFAKKILFVNIVMSTFYNFSGNNAFHVNIWIKDVPGDLMKAFKALEREVASVFGLKKATLILAKHDWGTKAKRILNPDHGYKKIE